MARRKESAEDVRQRALARLHAERAYNVNPWVYVGGLLAAIFSILFTLYAISRERGTPERADSPAGSEQAPSAPSSSERLIWVK